MCSYNAAILLCLENLHAGYVYYIFIRIYIRTTLWSARRSIGKGQRTSQSRLDPRERSLSHVYNYTHNVVVQALYIAARAHIRIYIHGGTSTIDRRPTRDAPTPYNVTRTWASVGAVHSLPPCVCIRVYERKREQSSERASTECMCSRYEREGYIVAWARDDKNLGKAASFI